MHVRQREPTSLRIGHFGLGADLPALLVLITDQAARPRHGVDGNYAQVVSFAKSGPGPENSAQTCCNAATTPDIGDPCSEKLG